MASHSHHFWPDITLEAMMEYWNDSAKFTDQKWDFFHQVKLTELRKLIAHNLSLPDYKRIVFASNTHELVFRAISHSFKREKKLALKVLTTDSEFHSFSRQLKRLEEFDWVEVDTISTTPFEHFLEHLWNKIQTNSYDVIFISQVFFNSGMVVNKLNSLINLIRNSQKEHCMVFIDGYHGFMAIPTDLSQVADRIFYVAGGYKYAQGGEGCAFMTVPSSFSENPLYTGWFAAGEASLNPQQLSRVSFSKNGADFLAGSTMDYTAMYRQIAVLKLFKNDNVTVDAIHNYVKKLQLAFRQELANLDHPDLQEKNIVAHDFENHGHFFAFSLKSSEYAKNLCVKLNKEVNIITDVRDNKLRFGFGMYQKPDYSFLKLIS